MNLMNLSFLIGGIVFIWLLTFLGFSNVGWIVRGDPLLPQADMVGGTVAVTAVVCLAFRFLFEVTGPKVPR